MLWSNSNSQKISPSQKYIYKFTMEYNPIIAIKVIRENTTYIQFNEILNLLREANNEGKLIEFIDQAEHVFFTEDRDFANSFDSAYYDVIQDSKDI